MKIATVVAGNDPAPRLAMAIQTPIGIRLLSTEAARTDPRIGFCDDGGSGRCFDAILPMLESGPEGFARLERMQDLVCRRIGDGNFEQIASLFLDPSSVTFLPPVPRPGKILAAGRNYRRPNAEDVGPTHPPIFAKFPSTMVGHERPVKYPTETACLDYEVELAVVIGKPCRDVSASNALDFVAGYTIFNDLTMSDIQRRELSDGLMLFGKNADDSGPCGPWMVTRDEIPEPNNLQISLAVNGHLRQLDSTASMIFNIEYLVAYCSRITLHPGDIIATGTPAGGAAHRDEPDRYWLRPGNVVEATIEGIGALRNRILAMRSLKPSVGT